MFRVWSNVELLGKVCSCQQDTVTVKIDRRWSEKWRERFIWSLLNYNTTADLMPEQPLPHLSPSRRNNLKEDFCSQQSHRLRSNLKSHLNPQLYFFFPLGISTEEKLESEIVNPNMLILNLQQSGTGPVAEKRTQSDLLDYLNGSLEGSMHPTKTNPQSSLYGTLMYLTLKLLCKLNVQHCRLKAACMVYLFNLICFCQKQNMTTGVPHVTIHSQLLVSLILFLTHS